MIESEWLEIAAVIRERWSHSDLPIETLRRWGADLQDLEPDHVAAAVEVLYRGGERHAPNGAQIRAKVVELMLDAPPWSVVLRELRGDAIREPEEDLEFCEECERTGWLVVETDHGEEARACSCRAERIAARRSRVENRHRLIREFAGLFGAQVDDALDGTRTGEAQLREKWREFCDRKHFELSLAGVPPAGLPALERVNREAPRSIAEIVDGVRRQIEAESAA